MNIDKEKIKKFVIDHRGAIMAGFMVTSSVLFFLSGKDVGYHFGYEHGFMDGGYNNGVRDALYSAENALGAEARQAIYDWATSHYEELAKL